ncbi:hypothetical protein FHS78_001382 [Parvibaculum indicum]|uniref:hypothetical protein n=1 Tax=Parvibaculum indicum TaxID=562969 RepID=UPI0014225A9B|nr:hypothetical protein [Parvibaculum indicum]NIJ41101.1 hypothetical protein [Parvibaculum indicum]
MDDTIPLIEKCFEIWPGLMRFAAVGEGAHAALAAAMDAARETSGALLSDAELLSSGLPDVLPRGAAARRVAEHVRRIADAARLEPARLPPVAAALPGAVCDHIADAMAEAGGDGCAFLTVSLGDAMAVKTARGVATPPMPHMPPVLCEFLTALGPGFTGGAAMGGTRADFPTEGFADMVGVAAGSAAEAGYMAAALSDAVYAGGVSVREEPLRDRIAAMSWEGRKTVFQTGTMEPDAIWDALSSGVRRAAALREARLLRAAALGLKGRGRTVGPVDGDKLLRFGVSEWR